MIKAPKIEPYCRSLIVALIDSFKRSIIDALYYRTSRDPLIKPFKGALF